MARLVALVCLIVVSLGLTACGSSADRNKNSNKDRPKPASAP